MLPADAGRLGLSMADHGTREAFFAGYYKKVPQPLILFLVGIGAVLLVGFVTFGLALGGAVDGDSRDPPEPAGAVTALPDPVLWLHANAAHPAARTIMPSGVGRYGVQALAGKFDGRWAAPRPGPRLDGAGNRDRKPHR
ncbi:MAG: hypothetical protein WAS21_26740 [Geminicoccaceae bacterium]